MVLSDLHENSGALQHFIRIAEHLPGGFDDIWLLGDVFGHSDDATGLEDLTQEVMDELMILMRYKGPAVQGNWEYWLTHPERDRSNKDQGKYTEQLTQRRTLLEKKKYKPLLDRLSANTALVSPETGEFTLFHGCSYCCLGNSVYQPQPCECYLFPRDLNTVTRGLFGNAENLRTPHFLFGHTHTPGFFTYSAASMINLWQFFPPDRANQPISYGDSNQRYGINPGSAGIAWRGLPRTALLLDTNEKTFTYLIDEERQTL